MNSHIDQVHVLRNPDDNILCLVHVTGSVYTPANVTSFAINLDQAKQLIKDLTVAVNA